MTNVLSGPMFEQSGEMFESHRCHSCGRQQRGAHYNQFHIKGGIDALKCIFPEGEADGMNFCLFSTSGVHGTYTTLEEIEASIEKYGEDFRPNGDDEYPEDWAGNELTVLIIQPRIVCSRYGNITVRKADIPYLKQLRQSSWDAVQSIGKKEER